MKPEITFMGNIVPTDVKIFYKDGNPYLDYTGTVQTNLGKIKIHFPQIGLEFSKIESERKDEMCTSYGMPDREINISHNMFISNDEWCSYEILEREMTKEDLERTLGYKVKLVDNK